MSKCSANLSNHFVNAFTFNKQVYPSIANPVGLTPQGECFLLENTLYVPVVIGAYINNPGLIGYFTAAVSNKLELDSGYISILKSIDDFKAAGIKLSSQIVKLLNSCPAHTNLIEDTNWNSTKGYRCKSEDFIKAIAMGYLELRDRHETTCQLATIDHSLQVDTNTPDKSVALKKVVDYFNAEHKRDSSYMSKWIWSSAAYRLQGKYERTALDIDPAMEVKWRKPNKNSKWPWTLDHHWFNVQESPIAVQNDVLLGLMGRHGSADSREVLNFSLPTFKTIRTMELTRKLLEDLFTNWCEIVNKNSQVGANYYNKVNDLEWPTGRYGSKRLTGNTFPVKACLSLGVRPSFNGSTFDKFISCQGNLLDNSEVLYIYPEIKHLYNRTVSITAPMMLYSAGLISKDEVELIAPNCFERGRKMENNPDYVKIKVSNNVVWCLPFDICYKAVHPRFMSNILASTPQLNTEGLLEEEIEKAHSGSYW